MKKEENRERERETETETESGGVPKQEIQRASQLGILALRERERASSIRN